MKTAQLLALVRLSACVALVLWLAGCASQKVDWAGRVGQYTYDQAVVEMGPPDREAKLADGTVVAEWLTGRGATYVYGTGDPFWPYAGGTATAQTTPNRFVRLTFGADGKLAGWKRVYK